MTPAPQPAAPRIPADVLAELRWQAEHPAAIVTVPKPVLLALVDAYTKTARRELLARAVDRLERAERHDRWGAPASDYADQAALLLRQAGLHALAERLEDDPWGSDTVGVLAELMRDGGM